MHVCPQCNSPVRPRAGACRSCGYRWAPSASPEVKTLRWVIGILAALVLVSLGWIGNEELKRAKVRREAEALVKAEAEERERRARRQRAITDFFYDRANKDGRLDAIPVWTSPDGGKTWQKHVGPVNRKRE